MRKRPRIKSAPRGKIEHKHYKKKYRGKKADTKSECSGFFYKNAVKKYKRE